MKLSILYRGSLSSCNYGCDYCPFAKKVESREEHQHDADELERFLQWVQARPAADELEVFFTPWGEALIHKRYQDTLAQLSRLPQIKKVAIQTNLSCRLNWTENCDKEKLALWCTFHPGETTRAEFLRQCELLLVGSVRFSVGVVGLKEHISEIVALRSELPSSVYLWINAYKRVADYYSNTELQTLEAIDPLFMLNTQYHRSLGEACRCGETVISVDGDGTIQRCHFIKTSIGNIYDPEFEQSLKRRPCSAQTCGCHIGYVHMDSLGLYDVFDGGILERIPAAF